MLYIIGLYDDLHGVSYRIKFVVQILAAALPCISGLWISNLQYIFFINEIPFWIGMPVTVLFSVYVTNAMNLIDGIDGLASGLSIMALAVIAILNITTGDTIWALLSLTYVGVLIAFFYYNVYAHKHKTFMGDTGSLTLGFTLAFLILHYWQLTPVWNPYFHNVGIVAVSTIIIPCLDVIRVMASRIRDGRNPFLPDKNHIHHKLMRSGMDQHHALITILAVAVLFTTVNIMLNKLCDASLTLILIIDVVLYVALNYAINLSIRRRGEKPFVKREEA